jgi:putative ABC transport system substrate-binding protein
MTNADEDALLQTLGKLAAELVALGPDAIITVATPPVIATKRATTTIPIVVALAADPVRSGSSPASPIPVATSRAS